MPKAGLTGYPSIDRTHLQGIPKEVLDPKIYPLSILEIFLKVNKDHLDEIAVDTGEKQYTKQEIKDLSIAVARGLMASWMKPGSKIVHLVPICIESVLMMIGANAIGVQSAVINPQSEHLDEELEVHQPQMIVVAGMSSQEMQQLLRDHPGIWYVVDVQPKSELLPGRCFSFDELITTRAQFTTGWRVQLRMKRYALSKKPTLYLHTSGSTGVPKILQFTNEAIFAALIYAANSTGTKARDKNVDRVLCVLPYWYPYTWMTLFVNLMGGNQVVLGSCEEEAIGEWYKYNASYIYGIPSFLRPMMERTPADADLSSLVAFFSAGSTNSEELIEQSKAFFAAHNSHAEIRTNYGLGEGLCIGTASDGIPHKPGTVGKFYVGPEWLIVDDDGNEVKYGEVGKVIVASKSLCRGYYKNPEETAKAFIKRDGKTFFCPGDKLSLAEDGYVTFVGRDKRIFLVTSGAQDKVNCDKIEQALTQVSLVEQAAVVVGHAADGQDYARAFVVLADDVQPEKSARDEIMTDLLTLLRDYEIPQVMEFVDEIPRLGSGKPDYVRLEKM